MPNYVKNNCVICNKEFEVIYKKRKQKTCSKECGYKLRKLNKNTFTPVEKTCQSCNSIFLDKTKLSKQKTCRKCVLKKGVESRKRKGSYKRTKEQNDKASQTLKQKHASGELEISQTQKDIISKSLKSRWYDGSMKEKSYNTCMEKYGVGHWTKSNIGRNFISKAKKGKQLSDTAKQNMSRAAAERIRNYPVYSFGNGGIREDLGFYVRSNWEANFARVLKYENVQFDYEPKTFILNNSTTYTPDFRIKNIYFEIKGYMNESSKNKIDTFRKLYPQELLVLIEGFEYNLLRNIYKNKVAWEGK